MPPGNSRNGVQTLRLSASTTHLHRAGMQLLGRANLHKNWAKLYKKRNQKMLTMETLRRRLNQVATSVGQLNKRWQVREGPAGSRVMGVCAKTRKRYLAGKPGAGAGQEPGQLPTSPTSHCPNFPLPQSHMCRVISCPLLHHIPPLVVLTRLEREGQWRTSFTPCDRRLPTASQEPVWRPG